VASTKERILAVEDDPNLARLLEAGLPRHGFLVRVVPDGKSATEVAEHWRPDLVLLDLDIPVLNGFEVLEQFRARGLETRVIIMSGRQTDVSTVVACIKSGACDFIPKPVELATLACFLRRHLVIATRHGFVKPVDLATKLDETERKLRALLDETHRGKRTTKQRYLLAEICTKFVYLAMASVASLLAFNYGGLTSGFGAGILLFALFLLLLMPNERLRSLTARWRSGEASVQIEPGERVDLNPINPDAENTSLLYGELRPERVDHASNPRKLDAAKVQARA